MAFATPPTLPADIMHSIARATLAAEEGNKVKARVRLGLVSRAWRDTLRGVPLHMELDDDLFCANQELSLERLAAVLQSGCFDSVDLVERLARTPPPRTTLMLIMASLAGSKLTLTELHGLPLVKPEEQPQEGLLLFSRLRSLTLLQTCKGLSVLRLAQQLPASVEELTLTLTAPYPTAPISLPLFRDLESLPSLRQLTVSNYMSWGLRSTDGERGGPLRVPPSFQTVRIETNRHLDDLGLVRTDDRNVFGAEDHAESDNGRRPAVLSPLGPVAVTLELSSQRSIQMMTIHSPDYAPDGRVLDWHGPGTNLPANFATFHAVTNELRILAEVRLPCTGPDSAEAQRVRVETPVQLLCRALRVAPASYRRFELEAQDPDRPLTISVYLQLRCGGQRTEPDITTASFNDAAGLAAAMQQFAAAEGLSIEVSPDMDSVIVCRAGD